MSYKENFIQGILSSSVGGTWDEAKLEWKLSFIEILPNENHWECLCGYYPIKELCHIINKKNGNRKIVGNQCVKKFDFGAHKIISNIKKVTHKHDASLNPETIQYAYKHKMINNWEQEFYMDTMRKRNLTDRQMSKRMHINKKIVCGILTR